MIRSLQTWPSPSDPYDYKPVFANVYKRVREEYESGCVRRIA